MRIWRGPNVWRLDRLLSVPHPQPRSGGGHGVAPRGTVAVAVSVGRKDEDGRDCGIASRWWQWRRRRWGKGPVINRESSRASRASLLNKSLFGRWPRWPAILTGLPPTVRVAAAAFASCYRIHWRQQRRLATIEAAEGSSSGAAAAVHSSCCYVMCGSDFPMLPVEAYCRNSTNA